MDSVDIFNIKIRFYDGVESAVRIDETFYIGLCKFEADVADIIKIESELINKVVIAKNNLSGRFEEGIFNYLYNTNSKSILLNLMKRSNKRKNVKSERIYCSIW